MKKTKSDCFRWRRPFTNQSRNQEEVRFDLYLESTSSKSWQPRILVNGTGILILKLIVREWILTVQLYALGWLSARPTQVKAAEMSGHEYAF